MVCELSRQCRFPQIGKLSTPIKRLGAHQVDVVVVSVSISIPLFVNSLIAYGGYIPPIVCVIVALIQFANGTTIGKRLLGMRVVKTDGERAGFFIMLIRELIVKSIVAVPIALGLLWIIWDEDRQGWNDKIMNTWVVAKSEGVVEESGEDDSPNAPSVRMEDTDAYRQRRQPRES